MQIPFMLGVFGFWFLVSWPLLASATTRRTYNQVAIVVLLVAVAVPLLTFVSNPYRDRNFAFVEMLSRWIPCYILFMLDITVPGWISGRASGLQSSLSGAGAGKSLPSPALDPVSSKQESAFRKAFNGLQGVIWEEGVAAASTEGLPIGWNEAADRISFSDAEFKNHLIVCGESSFTMAFGAASGSFFTTEAEYARVPEQKLSDLVESVYRLFLTNVWDVVGAQHKDAKKVSLVLDALLIPATQRPLAEDQELQAYFNIPFAKTGPGDRVWECCKRCIALLGDGYSADVLSSHLKLTTYYLDHKHAMTHAWK